ncbi:MAG: hypothetical protein ACTTJ7_00705 [Treponema sp.]
MSVFNSAAQLNRQVFKRKLTLLTYALALFFAASIVQAAAQTPETAALTASQQQADAAPSNSSFEPLSIDECEAQLEQYYRSTTIDRRRLFTSFEQAHAALSASDTDGEQLMRYLAYAKLISVLYLYGGDRQCKKYLAAIDEQVLTFFNQTVQHRKEAKLTNVQVSALYLRYADYLYTKLALQDQVNGIAAALPVLYRKALLLNPDNTEALVKLACWHIFPADKTTTNYNSFIESQEAYLEELNPADQCTAYMMYSMYYMKKYNSQKGREYLAKAAALFPNHIVLLYLYDNYKKGIFTL